MKSLEWRLDWMVGALSVDLVCLRNDALPAVRGALNQREFEFVVIDLSSAESATDFFFQIIAQLPCDPPYHHETLVDAAVADSLFEGLHHKENLAILLFHAELLVSKYVNLLFYFHEVINYTVTVKRAGKDSKMQRVKIFAFGEGDNFVSVDTSGSVAIIKM